MRLFAIAFALLSSFSAGLAAESDVRLVNLSSRSVVSSTGEKLVTGFVISGDAPKDILLRALGPALGSLGVTGELAQPRLEVYDANHVLVANNEQWAPALREAFAKVGAAPLAENSRDAAVRLTLAPGAYRAEVTGVDGGRGVVLVEVYELNSASRLVNLSTRAQVEDSDGVLLSGFVVSGTGSRRVLVRAAGPALAALKVQGALADPVLTLLDAKGRTLASSDNWDEGGLAAEIRSTTADVGASGFAAGSKDSAMVVDLAPGVYSVQVRGAKSGTGVVLLEIYDVAPKADVPEYASAALGWTAASLNARLGPTFAQLNPAASEDRPTHSLRQSVEAKKFFIRINPFELGTEPGPDTDYWSDSGQVAYVPDDPENDPGLDRIQTFAYYNKVFATSPRLDWASGKPHPDGQTRDPYYVKLNGGIFMQPIAMVRSYAMQQNEALVIYRNGWLAVAGTQTSRSGSERPYPALKFPANKIPRGLAITTSNEFALVTVWDTDRHQGQLAVVALEAKYLKFHTWSYIGFPNQGSFSDFKLLGYIDLPMASPNLVAAASNGLWTGPSSTGNRVLSQIKLTEEVDRKLVYDGDWAGTVARGGYAIVASTEENKAVIVDLTPLIAYMRDSYLKSTDNFERTMSNRGAAPDQFPQTFAVMPSLAPKLIWQAAIPRPTAVLAGHKIDRWSADRYKAYVASEDGNVHIIDTSSLMARSSTTVRGELKEIGSVFVGRNPVSMVFTRYGDSGLPLLPNDSKGVQRAPDPLNNMFYVACRGERDVAAVVTWHGEGKVYRRIRDSRMGDPVAVSVAVRGNIVSVADFAGKKILSFRIGTLKDFRNDVEYLPLGEGDAYEFTGELPFAGNPFLLNSTNVN